MHDSEPRRRVFNWVELLGLVLIIGPLLALLLPALLHTRSDARRPACANNMKQLGTALHNYAHRHGAFPPASMVTRDADGRITAVDGWSWTTLILPETENKAVYELADIHADKPGDTSNAAVREVLNTSIGELICPSYDGPRYADPKAKAGAITNYKAMGATHWESLSVATAGPEVPKYLAGKKGKHPDGAMYPASAHKPEDFKRDGTSRTIFITETTEPVAARWAVGSEATLVGLPPSVTFALPTFASGRPVSYYAPTGFDGKYGDENCLDAPRTYLDWDYEDPDDGPYLPGKNQGTFGPGSPHPGMVNHLFVDAKVHSISTDIDPALYMFLITRDGGDPTGEFFKD